MNMNWADNSRIKARTVLRQITRNPNESDKLAFDIQPPICVPYSPLTNRGERNNEPKPHEYTSLPSYEVKTTRIDERWNRYRIIRMSQIVRLRLSVIEIWRITDRFTNKGLPCYLLTHSPLVNLNLLKNGLRP